MLKIRCLAYVFGVATMLVSNISFAQDGRWEYSTGIDYSSGDYGGDPIDTNIGYVPFTAAYQTGLWTLRATVPWVQIEGPGTVLGAGDGGVVIGNQRRNQSQPLRESNESGLGDVWVSATYEVEAVPSDLFYLDLGAKVKLPTADEDKGLGTGKADYTVQADIFKPIGNATPFLTLAYKIKGEPADIKLDNVMFVSVGSDFTVSAATHAGLSVDYQKASFAGSDDVLELVGYLNQDLDENWSLTLYGYRGLEDGSPDLGIGLQVTYRP